MALYMLELAPALELKLAPALELELNDRGYNGAQQGRATSDTYNVLPTKDTFHYLKKWKLNLIQKKIYTLKIYIYKKNSSIVFSPVCRPSKENYDKGHRWGRGDFLL